MKTIFRFLNIAVLLAAIIAVGTVVGLAQDPTPAPANPNCLDAAGQSAARDNITALFQKKDLESLRLRIEAGKQFLDKYGSCGASVQDMVDYLKVIPTWEATYKQRGDKEIEDKLVARFDAGLNAKNWDEVYAAGKEILTKYPGKYMPAEIVLGSIGYDEAFKSNNKYNDDTLKFARQSLADLEAGKSFTLGKDTRYGLSLKDAKDTSGKTYVYNFEYSNKEDAIGWLNAIIGYMIQVGQKNLKDAQPYLYKATQVSSSSNKDPKPYELIGWYYWDQLATLSKEIKTIADSQKPEDTPEVAKQKVDDIEAKVALANGYADRAADAFARAYTLGAAKAYKDLMYGKVQDAYKAHHGDLNGLTPAWVADVIKKPLPNPTTPVTPIADPKAATTTTGTVPATTPATTKPAGTAPANNNVKPAAKPGGTAPVKPAGAAPAKPATKRQAAVKKPVARKKA